jgi:hypothetical protein
MADHTEKPISRQSFIWSVVLVAVGALFIGYIVAHIFSSSSPTLGGDESTSKIGIPELVGEVRKELIQSDLQRTKDNTPALFVAKSVELEISFVVKKADSAGSKISLEVVNLEGKRQVSSEKTQKMTLHLDIQEPQEVSIPPTLKKR